MGTARLPLNNLISPQDVELTSLALANGTKDSKSRTCGNESHKADVKRKAAALAAAQPDYGKKGDQC
jgi:hypothetical protein